MEGKLLIDKIDWEKITLFYLKELLEFSNFFTKFKKNFQKSYKSTEHKFISYCASITQRLMMMEYSKLNLQRLYGSVKANGIKIDTQNTQKKFLFNYHLLNFTVNANAIIDNISWVLNYYYKLGYDERDQNNFKCIMFNSEFISELDKHSKEMVSKIKILNSSKEIKDWLSQLKRLARHPSVHNLIPKISQIVNVGSKKIDTKVITQVGKKFVEINPKNFIKDTDKYLITIMSTIFDENFLKEDTSP